MGDVIDVLIIGAQKSGTSSLKKYLSQCDALNVHDQQEITYFVNDEEYSQGFEEAKKIYFKNDTSRFLVGKSVGIMYEKEVLQRVKQHNPNVHLVLILRNPIDRAYSAFWYARRKGWEPIVSFEDAIKAGVERFGNHWVQRRNCDYLRRSQYIEQLHDIYECFPREHVHIYKLEDFKDNSSQVCEDIISRLGVGLGSFDGTLLKKRHNSSAMPRFHILAKISDYPIITWCVKMCFPKAFLKRVKSLVTSWNERPFSPPVMNVETRRQLITYFKGHNKDLAKKIVMNLDDWNK